AYFTKRRNFSPKMKNLAKSGALCFFCCHTTFTPLSPFAPFFLFALSSFSALLLVKIALFRVIFLRLWLAFIDFFVIL
ncbi:MAG: hypothetical protein IIV28_05095, partial [Alistipes sp.]|nr:hypothetical protein [Alistipes sp.]